MVEERDEERLDPVTERELGGLARERRPPEDLEAQVVADLRREGLLGPGRSASKLWIRAAAAAVFVAIGFAAGAWWMQPAPVAISRSGPRFLLLLQETPQSEASSPERLRALVEEYKTWAADGARQGFLLEGEKLKNERKLLPETAESEAPVQGPIGGYFVIRADDYEQALRLARTCPHLLHGGRIEVREIDPV